jgi:hypothetical protein
MSLKNGPFQSRWPPSMFRYITNNEISYPTEAFSNSLHIVLYRLSAFICPDSAIFQFYRHSGLFRWRHNSETAKLSWCFITILLVWNSPVFKHISALDHVDYLKVPYLPILCDFLNLFVRTLQWNVWTYFLWRLTHCEFSSTMHSTLFICLFCRTWDNI